LKAKWYESFSHPKFKDGYGTSSLLSRRGDLPHPKLIGSFDSFTLIPSRGPILPAQLINPVAFAISTMSGSSVSKTGEIVLNLPHPGSREDVLEKFDKNGLKVDCLSSNCPPAVKLPSISA
jgi:hypothetical protein